MAVEDSHYFCKVLQELFSKHRQLTASEKGLRGASRKAWLHYMSFCQTVTAWAEIPLSSCLPHWAAGEGGEERENWSVMKRGGGCDFGAQVQTWRAV